MRRWKAEPVRVGTERQLLITALPASHAGMHLLPNRKTWLLIPPGSPATSIRKGSCGAGGEAGGHAKFLGRQEENLETLGAKQRSRMSAQLLLFPAVSLAPENLQVSPAEMLGQAKISVPLPTGRHDYFLPVRLEHPSPECLVSHLYSGKDPVRETRLKEHIQAFEAFP